MVLAKLIKNSTITRADVNWNEKFHTKNACDTMRSMKTATVWIKDGAFALFLFLSPSWDIWQLKRSIPPEFAIDGKKNANTW